MSAAVASGVLAVMAKAPRAGLVKTRMCPPLTPAEAASFYAAMLGDVLDESVRAATLLGLEARVAVFPADGLEEVARLASPGVPVVAQRGGDLSERMQHAVDEAWAAGAERVLLRGSDSPALDAAHIAAAHAALAAHDLVLCPDLDGGYSLVGLAGPVARRAGARSLFDHAMSTDSVLDDTLARASECGFAALCIDPCFDLDTVDDLARLAPLRAEPRAAARCARTLAFADRHRL